jgi:hypothetical protein
MDHRLIVGILLLVLAWQGPALAYSVSLANPESAGSGMIQCMDDGNGCDGCCSHHPAFCATACALSLGAVVSMSLAPIVVPAPHLPIPDAKRPALLEHHPARLLRPPIV